MSVCVFILHELVCRKLNVKSTQGSQWPIQGIKQNIFFKLTYNNPDLVVENDI